jgi:hypothetical protein
MNTVPTRTTQQQQQQQKSSTHRVALTLSFERWADSEDAYTSRHDVVADVTFDEYDDASVVLLACEPPFPDDFAMQRIDEDCIAAALSAKRAAGEFRTFQHETFNAEAA